MAAPTREEQCHDRHASERRPSSPALRAASAARRALALAKAGAQVLVHYGKRGRRGRSRRRGNPRRPAGAPRRSAPIWPRRRARTSSPARSAPSSATGWTSWSPMPASPRPPRSRRPRSRISTPFAVNVRAPFFLVQQLLPILREGSSIVLLRRWRRTPPSASFGLCRDQGRHRHAGEAFRGCPRGPRASA